MSLNRKAIVVAVGAALAVRAPTPKQLGQETSGDLRQVLPEMTSTAAPERRPRPSPYRHWHSPRQGQGAIFIDWKMQITILTSASAEKKSRRRAESDRPAGRRPSPSTKAEARWQPRSFAGMSGGWGTISSATWIRRSRSTATPWFPTAVSSGNFVSPTN